MAQRNPKVGEKDKLTTPINTWSETNVDVFLWQASKTSPFPQKKKKKKLERS